MQQDTMTVYTPARETQEFATAADERRHVLAQRVARALDTPGAENEASRVISVSVAVDVPDAFFWLEAQPQATKVFWSARNEETSHAAVGEACRIEGGAATLPDLSGLPEAACYFGGARFDARAESEEWVAFPPLLFILPRFRLTVAADGATLSCNLRLPADRQHKAAILREVAGLDLTPGTLRGELPSPLDRQDAPEREGWNRNIGAALHDFEEEMLGKVVLARQVTYSFGESLRPILLLKRLSEATPGCFHFLFQPDGGAAFVGASPERLYRREGREVFTEAVAGTRPLGGSAGEDARLLEELLGSDKEQREHGYVREAVREVLAGVCDSFRMENAAGEMRLAMGRHLYSQASGHLREEVTDAELLRRLHPTPAVGGVPGEAAMAAIAELEPFDRGWYAGPVGRIGGSGAEFAVGIRSGLVADARLSLYSGAGIVRGSDAGAEYDEVEQKIGDFARILGLAGRRA